MKKLIACVLPALLLPFSPDTDGAPDEERAAVERAVLDYVEGVYEVRPELIERSVSKELKKYGYWRQAPEQPYQGMAMTYDELYALAGEYNKEGRVPEDAPKAVEVLDVLDQTAAAKLTASWGVDYMQLAKVEGQWKILHVLWQSPPL